MKSFLIVLALLITVPASAQPLGPAPYVVMTVGSSLDLATTLSALHGGAAVKEGNPVLALGGTSTLVGGKLAATASLAYVMQQLAKRGHPRIAAVLGYSAGIALSGLAYRNAQVGR